MTAFWLILACIAFVMVAGSSRGRPGRAVTDTTVLVMVLAMVGIADLLVSRFVYTGGLAWTVAALVALGFALDALYGLMAPQRQRQRDRKLRALLRRKPA